MKECKHCKEKFEPHQNRGHEQLYCSNKCRNRASVERRMSKYTNSPLINNKTQENEITTKENQGTRANIGEIEKHIGITNVQESNYGRNEIRNYRNDMEFNPINLLEKLYDARNETIFYKLKCESLQKENEELHIELQERDVMEDDNEEQENDYGGILGGIIEQFKQDPVTTINFTSELIGKYLNSKS